MISQQVRLAATDVSNHLACHHLTYLELSVARGEMAKPEWSAPDLVVIQELGLRHETKYLTHLKENGLEVLNLADTGSEAYILAETRRAGALRRIGGGVKGRSDYMIELLNGRASGEVGITWSLTDTELVGRILAQTLPESCSEIYREKAFSSDPQNVRRLPVAAQLGQESLMFLVHLTLSDIRNTCKAIEAVMARACQSWRRVRGRAPACELNPALQFK
jgi:hypothetical protein